MPRLHRYEYVAQAHFFMPNVPLLLEHSELCANRGRIRFAGQLLHHLVYRGAAAPVEDVHDLPLAAAENGMDCFWHGSYFYSETAIKIADRSGDVKLIFEITPNGPVSSVPNLK